MNDFVSTNRIILIVFLVLVVMVVLWSLFDSGSPRYIPQNLQRSNDYRTKYFKAKKGLFGKGIYFCPFCGKLMRKKEKIQVDHINAIHRVQKSKFLRERFKKLPDGVNDTKNLVHACPRCNRRKGAKGGLWVLLGYYGQYFMPPLRWAAYVAVIYLVRSAVLFGVRSF